MASLFDIAPAQNTVPVRGVDVEVNGVSATGLAHLLRRFPELVEAIQGKELSVDSLYELGPRVVAAVIAAGTGAPGDANAEGIAETLAVADQLELLAAIVPATFPQGVENFMNRLAALAEGVGTVEKTS